MKQIKRIKIFQLLVSGFTYAPIHYISYITLMIFFGLIVPIFIEVQKDIIDIATNLSLGSDILTLLMPIIVGYFILYYLDSMSINLANIIYLKISHRTNKQVMQGYLRNISTMDYANFENAKVQDAMMRISANQKAVYEKSIVFFPNIIRRVIELGGILFFLIRSGVWWSFPLSILFSIPSFYFNKKRILHARKVWSRDSFEWRYTTYLNENLLNKESSIERRFFDFYGFFSKLWDVKFKEHNRNKIKSYVKSSLATGVAMCFSMSVILVVGLAMLSPLKDGRMTIGLYTSVLLAVVSKMNMGISAIIREYTNLINIKHYVDDYTQVQPIYNKENDKKLKQQEITFESIEFDDVWFAYPNSERYILKGVSFTINKHERHALIGINGAGKTTITKLMMGLYKPNRGKIYINRRDISTYSPIQIQSLYAAIQQNFAKYKNKLKENVGLYTLGYDKLDQDKMKEALERCMTEDILKKCNNDFNTVLSTEFTNGIMLSGGEWQKVAITRAFYSEREFILFDEPTAALDPLAEVDFYENYNNIMQNRTCLFITHRLGSTHLFQNCLVMSEGRIVEQGDHKTLISLNGKYKELYEKQKTWYEGKEVI